MNETNTIETIKAYTWDGYAMQVERYNLAERGESLSAASIMMRAQKFIVEIRPDLTMIVKVGWRKVMREET